MQKSTQTPTPPAPPTPPRHSHPHNLPNYQFISPTLLRPYTQLLTQLNQLKAKRAQLEGNSRLSRDAKMRLIMYNDQCMRELMGVMAGYRDGGMLEYFDRQVLVLTKVEVGGGSAGGNTSMANVSDNNISINQHIPEHTEKAKKITRTNRQTRINISQQATNLSLTQPQLPNHSKSQYQYNQQKSEHYQHMEMQNNSYHSTLNKDKDKLRIRLSNRHQEVMDKDYDQYGGRVKDQQYYGERVGEFGGNGKTLRKFCMVDNNRYGMDDLNKTKTSIREYLQDESNAYTYTPAVNKPNKYQQTQPLTPTSSSTAPTQSQARVSGPNGYSYPITTPYYPHAIKDTHTHHPKSIASQLKTHRSRTRRALANKKNQVNFLRLQLQMQKIINLQTIQKMEEMGRELEQERELVALLYKKVGILEAEKNRTTGGDQDPDQDELSDNSQEVYANQQEQQKCMGYKNYKSKQSTYRTHRQPPKKSKEKQQSHRRSVYPKKQKQKDLEQKQLHQQHQQQQVQYQHQHMSELQKIRKQFQELQQMRNSNKELMMRRKQILARIQIEKKNKEIQKYRYKQGNRHGDRYKYRDKHRQQYGEDQLRFQQPIQQPISVKHQFGN